MAAVRIRVIGISGFRRSLDRAGRTLPRRIHRQLERASNLVVREAQKEGFKGSRTRARVKGRPVTSPLDKLGVFEGTYRRAITYDIKRAGRRRLLSEVGPANIRYARVHEFGLTMPGRTIRPKKPGGVLRWFDKANNPVFARSAKMPAYRMPKRPVLGPAVRETEEQVFRLIGRSFQVIR